jgi:serine protease SohB
MTSKQSIMIVRAQALPSSSDLSSQQRADVFFLPFLRLATAPLDYTKKLATALENTLLRKQELHCSSSVEESMIERPASSIPRREKHAPCRRLLLWFMILLVLLLPVGATPKKKKSNVGNPSGRSYDKGSVSDFSTDEEIDGTLIEDNPNYLHDDVVVADLGDSDSDDGSENDDDDDSGDEENSGSSESLKSKREKSKGITTTLKKHRMGITLAVALLAFRKEILALVIHMFKYSGNNFSLTDVLKLILFVDAMRKLQTGGSGLFSSNERGGSLFSTLTNFMATNPAFIPPITQHYTFERINEYFVRDAMALNKAIKQRHEGLSWSSPRVSSFSGPSKLAVKLAQKPNSENSQTIIIVDWTKLDSALTSMEQMREQISFLLSEYRSFAMKDARTDQIPDLEVVLLLESPGGSVAEYGLAGSLLMQLRDTPGVTLTICVDKVAASGGYLLCCTASPGKLFAAPFAMIGSIGVIGQLINIQDLLTGWGVHPLVFRGGKDKAPVGLIGDITDEGKQTTQEMIDQTHVAFKNHVLAARPILREKIAEVGSGHVWLGVDALGLNLIDGLKTSEEYIGEKLREGARVLKMVRHRRVGFGSFYGPSGMEMKVKTMFTIFGQLVHSSVQSLGVGRFGLAAAPIDNISSKHKTG